MLSNGFWDIGLISGGEYANHIYSIKGKFLYVDGIIVGTAVALTTYAKYRQSGSKLGIREKFDDNKEKELKNELDEIEKEIDRRREQLKYCFFDEFEPLEPLLKAEQRKKAFKHILENLFRMRTEGVHIILAANIVNAYSPILEMLEFPETSAIPEYGFFKSYTARTKKPLAVRYRPKPNKYWVELRGKSIVGMMSEREPDAIMTTGAATEGVNYKPLAKHGVRTTAFNLMIDNTLLTVWGTQDGSVIQITRRGNNMRSTYAFDSRNTNANVRLIPLTLRNLIFDRFKLNQIEYESGKEFELIKGIMPNK